MNKLYRNMEYSVTESNSITGHPIVFESLTDIGTHYEIIKRGALDGTDLSDVSLLINHNFDELPIARYRQGKESTLKLNIEDDGLHFETNLDPQNPRAAEVLSCIKRGDIQKMSFGMFISMDDPTCCYWIENPNDKPTLVIKHIDMVFDISVVTWPAYEDTSVQIKRSKEEEDIEESNIFELYTERKNEKIEKLKAKMLAMFPIQ